MDLDKYRELFLQESREHLQNLNRDLLRLEEEGDAFDGVDGLFREAHSIKGMSGSMGYDAMVAVGHALEDILDRLRQKTLASSADLVSLLCRGVDVLEKLTDEVEERGETTIDVDDIVRDLREAAAGAAAGASAAAPPAEEAAPPAAAEVVALSAEEADTIPDAVVLEETGAPAAGDAEVLPAVTLAEGHRAYRVTVRISGDSAALAARNFVVLSRLRKLGEIVSSAPTREEVMAGTGREELRALFTTTRSVGECEARLRAVPEVVEITLVPETPAGKTVPAPQPQAPAPASAPAAAPTAGEEPATGGVEQYLPRKTTTVRVDTRILDDLINIVGELIINRERLLDLGRDIDNEPLQTAMGRLDVLVREFQDTIMAVRMMPLEMITGRLPRIVRDLAHRGGKQVRFDVVSKGIELDRSILEEMNDVLIHLVRNAIDHGIETVEERREAGKSPQGRIRLQAGRERDWVWIRVEDDGRGVDPAKIVEAALKRGVVTEEQAAALGDRERLMLVCRPGLSTAAEVSDVSGRGVGMDVVKSKVESFGGTVLIESSPGAGTRTTIRLPLTLAIIRILLVDVRGRHYGIPVSHVVHTLVIDGEAVQRSQNRLLVTWRSRLIPLVDLGAVTGAEKRAFSAGEQLHVVITEFGGRTAALAVDGLLGSAEAVIKPLGPPLKRVKGLAGVTILGDGRTVIVLDVAALA